jgi:hypothetical protein
MAVVGVTALVAVACARQRPPDLTLPAGSLANAVNDRGVVVGTRFVGFEQSSGWSLDTTTGQRRVAAGGADAPVTAIADVNAHGLAAGMRGVSQPAPGSAGPIARTIVGSEAVVWDTTTGALRVLPVEPPYRSADARGIADTGVVVGAVVPASSGRLPAWSRAARWDLRTGALQVLDPMEPGPAGDTALGVSPSGRFIVGTAGTRGFVWEPATGTTRLLAVADAHSSHPVAVNDRGDAVGVATFAVPDPGQPFAATVSRAVRWDAATGEAELLALPVSGDPLASSSAVAVNGSGVVVGRYAAEGGPSQAYRLDPGAAAVPLGPEGTSALGVTSTGRVYGTQTTDGTTTVVWWDPTPGG